MREEVTEDEISEIVSKWTGIPVSKLMESEKARILKLPEILHKRVIGQDEAVQAVADAVLRARAGIKDPKHGRSVHLFSWGPREWAKPNLPKRLRNRFLTAKKIWCALT